MKCSICGCKTTQHANGHRDLFCRNCRIDFERDENAARNILMKGGVRFTPDGSPGEAQGTMQEPEQTAAILTVDGEKMALTRAS